MAKPKCLYFLENSAFAEEKFHIKMMQRCGCRLNVQIFMPKNQPKFGNCYTKKKKQKRGTKHARTISVIPVRRTMLFCMQELLYLYEEYQQPCLRFENCL